MSETEKSKEELAVRRESRVYLILLMIGATASLFLAGKALEPAILKMLGQ